MRVERKDLKPCDKKDGFFLFPENERYSVNKEGFVYDRKLDYNYGPYKKRYPTAGVYPVHEIVATTFLSRDHIPQGTSAVVNHVDGDTSNPKLSNLEWTTYSGNSIHAYRTGLRSDNIPLLCKNVETGEITRYYSYWDCARSHNVNGFKVHGYLNRGIKNRLFENKYVLIKEGDEWPDLDLEECYRNLNKGLLAFNRVTGRVFVADKASEIAKELKTHDSVISTGLKAMRERGDKYFIRNDWEIMPLSNASDFLKEKAITIESPKKQTVNTPEFVRKPKRVTIQDLKTFESKEYDSLETFCSEIGESKNTVQKHILKNNGFWRGEKLIRYID